MQMFGNWIVGINIYPDLPSVLLVRADRDHLFHLSHPYHPSNQQGLIHLYALLGHDVLYHLYHLSDQIHLSFLVHQFLPTFLTDLVLPKYD